MCGQNIKKQKEGEKDEMTAFMLGIFFGVFLGIVIVGLLVMAKNG